MSHTLTAPVQHTATPEQWLPAHGSLSQALDVASFAHPSVCRLEIRQETASGLCHVHVELPRRARKPQARIPLNQGSEGLFSALAATLGGAEEQARSLSRILSLLQPWAEREREAPRWAAELGETLGLGSSERWDPNYDDGIERDGDGLSIVERSSMAAHDDFPLAVEEGLRAGAFFTQGPAQQACSILLAELETIELENISSRSPEEAPQPPRASSRRRL